MTQPRYEVSIVRYGTRTGRRSEVYLNYALYDEADADIEMDYFFWVIRGTDRTVLVDSGFSPAGGAHRNRTTLAGPPELIRRLGIEPGDIDVIVVTHAHYDHIGNLDAFPSTPVLIERRELEFWTGRHASRRQFHHSVEDAEIAHLVAAAESGRVTTFEDSVSLAPGIEVVRIGGHTPGQSVVLVDTEEGVVLLASDSVHYMEELDREMPFMSVADLVAMYAGFDTIRDWVAAGEVDIVVPGHDPATLSRFRPHPDPDLADVVSLIGGRSPEEHA